MIAMSLRLNHNGDCFIGASPERLMKKENDHVYSACLAGSIARGKTDVEDEATWKDFINGR